MHKGLTLIEIVIVIALIAILSGIYLIASNPGGQLAGARNNERLLHLQTIMNAVRQNIADQSNEQFACSSGSLPTTTKRMSSTVSSSTYNIGPCLIGSANPYLFSLPFDPTASGAHYVSNTDYDTGYSIVINSSTGQVTLSAPYAESGKTVSVTR